MLICFWMIFGNLPQLYGAIMIIAVAIMSPPMAIGLALFLWVLFAIKSTYRVDYSEVTNIHEFIQTTFGVLSESKGMYGLVIYITVSLIVSLVANVFKYFHNRMTCGQNVVQKD